MWRTPPAPTHSSPPPSTWCLMLCLISTNSHAVSPLSTGLVHCEGPPPTCVWLKANTPLLHLHPPASAPNPTRHTCFLLFFLPLHLSLCLSTHLSLQRILHWSNECANSACCIKCGHPNKLHPLQGIGVFGSEAVIESPPRAPHRFTCSCQSPMPITTPVVEVLTCPAVSLQQQILSYRKLFSFCKGQTWACVPGTRGMRVKGLVWNVWKKYFSF